MLALCAAGAALLFALVCTISGRSIISDSYLSRSQLWKSNFTVTIVVAAYVLMPSIAGGITTALSCQSMGSSGQEYMTYALDVECGTGNHVSAAAAAMLVLLPGGSFASASCFGSGPGLGEARRERPRHRRAPR